MTGPCVITTYRGPTETRGARIVASCRSIPGLRSRSTSYDHGLSATENHTLAARLLVSQHWGGEHRLVSATVRPGVEAHIVVREEAS